MSVRRLFFLLLCCILLPLAAGAADPYNYISAAALEARLTVLLLRLTVRLRRLTLLRLLSLLALVQVAVWVVHGACPSVRDFSPLARHGGGRPKASLPCSKPGTLLSASLPH
jgi:hypothetical protein